MAMTTEERREARENYRDPKKRERYIDGLLRHQIYSLRMGGAAAQEVIIRLRKIDADIARRLERLITGKRPTAAEINAIIRRLVDFGGTATKEVREGIVVEMLAWAHYSLVRHEADLAILGISVDIDERVVAPRVVAKAMDHRMQSKGAASVGEMIGRATESTAEQVGNVARRAWNEGKSIDDARQDFKVLQIQRDSWLDTSIRTAFSSISSRAREAQYQQIGAIFPNEMWVATLDHRTSSICQRLDGEIFPKTQGPRPPAHPSCRSIRIPMLAGETAENTIGTRPSTGAGSDFVYKPGESQAALQRRLKLDQGVRKGRKGDDRFKRGQTRGPTYQEFLSRQSAAFQDFALNSPTRGRLFRSGEISFDRFFDAGGNYVPVRELLERIRRLES